MIAQSALTTASGLRSAAAAALSTYAADHVDLKTSGPLADAVSLRVFDDREDHRHCGCIRHRSPAPVAEDQTPGAFRHFHQQRPRNLLTAREYDRASRLSLILPGNSFDGSATGIEPAASVISKMPNSSVEPVLVFIG